ncbi:MULTISPECIES: formate dehydrogenase subunit delta [Thalassospira]|jgi:formate dehydrogenase subunit delta|uniref:Formate dehydrogenase n=3 Tax=Thalassospira TaxID=168934 RepID=A0A853KWC0_9PROT|nr:MULTISPECIES: formate dehydrogenase subunit delta [Thalassospira]OAZ12359.1 formate dehydrogenase [Thalassospira profundimaris]AXO14170.1 formate dehydrogenase [Thalassospira indica]KZC97563.1 formate dehydrogenase [Thalassospira sp. MCCC 1A02898]MBE70610.1 formate dehydrogenase [Thalassospira sp.]MBO6579974.1 formate dehydrogenase subunit delta [Thalassospira sp.]|tara:strand:+ start:72 stop:296 length:225 start_codon:yes stop_codon:yes gene_type:complete
MAPDKLVYMANQIATFFKSQPEGEGVDGVANHISDFWEPRMRKQLFDMIAEGKADFHPLVIKAAPKIRKVKETA